MTRRVEEVRKGLSVLRVETEMWGVGGGGVDRLQMCL